MEKNIQKIFLNTKSEIILYENKWKVCAKTKKMRGSPRVVVEIFDLVSSASASRIA